jgi:DNA-binding MurR/RpiR family transcriptional regulator
MNFMDNIQLKRSTLTKNEAKACDMICADLKLVQNCSIQELSDRIGVTKTTIMRFAQKMGYSGYSEFKYAVINYVNSPDDRDHSEEDRITSAENIYADTIRLIHHTADESKMKGLASEIIKARTVYLAGMINSHVSAMQMYYSLLMFGIRATVLDSVEAVKSVDMCVGRNDLVIVYSVSGKSGIMKAISELKDSTGCRVVMITSNNISSIADDSIVLPSLSVARGSLLEDVPVYSVFNAILVDYISQEKQKGKYSKKK